MSLLISLRSELIKIKRTASLKLCFITAALIPAILFLESLELSSDGRKGLPWSQHFLGGSEQINLAILPLFIILISTLLLQTEYRDKTWKQVFSSPQKLINVFLAKFIILHLLILLFLLSYNLYLIITGVSIELLHPELFDRGFNLPGLLIANAQTYFLIFGISAIQFWLSLRFKNFIAPIAIGFVLWFMAPMMIFELKWAIADKYPYSFSILSMHPKYKANISTYQWYSLANAVFFLAIAFVDFRVKRIKV
jgi:hypothetical protein